MMSKWLVSYNLQMYDMGQQEAWLCWFLMGEYGYYPTSHICIIHVLYIAGVMQQHETFLRWLLLRDFGHHITYHMSMGVLWFGKFHGTHMMGQ